MLDNQAKRLIIISINIANGWCVGRKESDFLFFVRPKKQNKNYSSRRDQYFANQLLKTGFPCQSNMIAAWGQNKFTMTVFESIADFEEYMPAGGRGDFFFVRNNNLLTKVMLYEIQWVSADGNYCVIQTDSKKFAVKVSLKKLSERLPAMDFIQIHKSYIARLEGIESVDIKEHIVTISGQSLPLGRTYKDALLARLEVL